jgi:outer membrane protein assembly factor BamE (lipoprotein component of BamABCDE complex)
MRRASACRAVFAGSLATLLSGCVPIPYVIPPLGYTSESRHNLGDRAPSFIVQGQTSREEVLYALGEPDTGDDQTFSYVSASRHGGVGTLIVPYVGNQIPDAHTQRVLFRRLIVQFDSDGRVSHFENQSKTCSIGYYEDDMFNHSSVSVNAFYRCLNAPSPDVPVSEAKTPADSSR